VKVRVLEKSRSFGGRCATRRWRGHRVDHGAQYFTMRAAAFRAEMEELCGPELSLITAPVLREEWSLGADPTERWYHRGGQSSLGKALATTLAVELESPVTSLHDYAAAYAAIVSAAPWPQTAALLGQAAGPDSVGDYAPCLTALFSYRGLGLGRTGEAYARQQASGALAWSAVENHKLGRIVGEETVLVVQASEGFSREYYEGVPAEWSELLRGELEAVWELPRGEFLESFTHRWKYSRLLRSFPTPELPAGFFVTGDSWSESRVEAAWLAGRATAEAVRSHLNLME
jgi:renalase